MPFNRSTADTIAPFSPVFAWKLSRLGLVPAPQYQREFPLCFPSAALARFRGWSLSRS